MSASDFRYSAESQGVVFNAMSLLQFFRQCLRGLDVGALRWLVATAQQQHPCIGVFRVVHAICRSVIDLHFIYAASEHAMLPWVPASQSIPPNLYPHTL